MTTEKTFLFVGVAEKKGIYKVRWANTKARIEALYKDGQQDVRLVELPCAMNKIDSVTFIMGTGVFPDDNAQAAFYDFLTTAKKSPLIIKPTIVMPEKEVSVVEELDTEDEPF